MRIGNFSIRKDKNVVALFSHKDGTKVRLGIGKYVKSTFPELVDIKINDYCPFNCGFCYQGSTPQGGHSSIEDLKLIIDRLADVGVFELASGGGEPTMHPNFVEFVEYASEKGITPNFTTKSPKMVVRLWDDIKNHIGGFAYSAETSDDIREAHKVFKENGIPLSVVNLHYVMGLGDSKHFSEYLMTAWELGFRVTLLGYKTTGRGGDGPPFPYDWWMDVVSALIADRMCPSLSIDTPLAEAYDGRMPVSNKLYHTREGAFSMYVDAVQMKMGASSFDPDEELVPFDMFWADRYSKL